VKCAAIFLYLTDYYKNKKTYLGVEGDGIQFSHPLVSGKDDLLCLCITFSFHAHMASMIYEGRQIAGIYRINDIEKELSFGSFLRKEFIWEKRLYFFLCLDHVKDSLDAELFIYGDLDKIDRRELEESLFSNEDFLNKIFVVFAGRREVVLKLI
jgi:hypothetical protein